MLTLRRHPTFQAKSGVAIFTSTSVYLIYLLILPNQHENVDVRLPSSLSALVVVIGGYFLFIEPIPQPQSYHNFADKRAFLCSCLGYSEGFFLPRNERRRGFVIPHFGDVVSNIIILLGGLIGTFSIQFARDTSTQEVDSIRQWQLDICLPLFFYSTVLISMGSTYYHWKPVDQSLVWDRMPMTVAFISIFCFMLEEYTSFGIGPALLPPLLTVGVFSIMYWQRTDDLRLYVLVQFLPLLIISMLLVSGDPKHGGKVQHVVALAFYAASKYCEDRDYEIFALTGHRLSGHSLKHVLAGLASIMLASSITK